MLASSTVGSLSSSSCFKTLLSIWVSKASEKGSGAFASGLLVSPPSLFGLSKTESKEASLVSNSPLMLKWLLLWDKACVL